MSTAPGDDVTPSQTAPAPEPGAFAELPPVVAPVGLGSARPGVIAPIPIVAAHQVEPDPPGEQRRTAIAAILVAAIVSLTGLGIGAIWVQVAPRIAVIKVADGFVYADSEPEQAVAADGVFGFLGLGAGVLVAVLAWVLVRRYRGVAVLVGLVAGSLVAAWLAWWLGVRMGMAQFDAVRDSAPIGARLEAPLTLHLTDLDRHAYWPPKVTGVVAAQALMAAVSYTTLAGFSIHPGLRPPRRRPQADGLSSHQAAPADPTG